MAANELPAAYDEEAEAVGWYGPEVAFGLIYAHVQPGQAILDIGIGTGLSSELFRKAGLRVHGMDNSPQMLEVCRRKGLTALQLHDAQSSPYPYPTQSMDHAVCTGVLPFLRDPTTVFQEVGRVLKRGGWFVFVVNDRQEDDPPAIEVDPQRAGAAHPVTLYRHSAGQIEGWLKAGGFRCARRLAFTVFMDRERARRVAAKAYVARKGCAAAHCAGR